MQVGDYELGTSLRDVLFQMVYLLRDNGNRNGDMLCEKSSDEVFLLVDKSLYNCIDEIEELSDNSARFDISIPVDIFDSWKIFLIECGNNASLVFKNDIENNLLQLSIPIGEFDKVIKETYKNINEIYETLSMHTMIKQKGNKR